jgi:hypothetical protein
VACGGRHTLAIAEWTEATDWSRSAWLPESWWFACKSEVEKPTIQLL